ncbi:MAG: MATE family multidrug resistance protein [Candidatus Azotimanducaceae bacterium]|jgi:MATE family multidrug resistance protein
MTQSVNKSEARQLSRLALPLMATQLAQMGMGVVDTVMAGRYSSIDLAGVALGSAVFWPCILLMMGVLQVVTPTVAQLSGANKQNEVGEVIRQALWIALLAAIFMILVLVYSEPFYALMNISQDAIAITMPYLAYTAWGMPAIMVYFVLRFLAEGLGFTKPAMYIAIAALLLKIPLNYIFVNGLFGMPEMGGVGCGLATAIVMWLELFLIVYVVTRAKFNNIAWQEKFSKPDSQKIFGLIKVGLPIGATMFFEAGMFTSVTVLLGQIGTNLVAAHSIALNITGLTYMLPLSLGIAASIRIGNHVGANQFSMARKTAQVAMTLSLTVAVISIAFMLLTRHFIVGLYTSDPVVFEIAVTLLLFAALYQLFDASQATAIGALRGYKDTAVPMYFTLIGYWLFGLPLAASLGFGWVFEPMGIYGFWVGLILALFAVSLCAVARLYWLSGKLIPN